MKTNNERILEERQRIQDTLESLYHTTINHIITVDLTHTSKRNPFTNTMEPCIKCVEHRTKEVIGWFPESMIFIDYQTQMTGFINHKRNGRYYVCLDKQQTPNRYQYHIVKDYCQKHNLTMPAYDARAYYDIYDKINAEKGMLQKVPA